MSVSGARNFIAGVMIALVPLQLLAAETGAAVVHSTGGVWVNGSEVVDSSTIFPGDLLQTKPGFVANLDSEGSSVLIQPESAVEFHGNFLTLVHGTVSVGTSTSMGVHVNCLRVEPVTSARTQYDVTDTNGAVLVAAHKNDVDIKQGNLLQKASKKSEPSQSATVKEGQEAKRNESQDCAGGPRTPAAGHALSPKLLEIGGGGAAGVLILCLLLCRGTSTTPVSPSDP
ncbi:MAG TPA: hypothetical protein VFF64_08210 [Candidatus Eremiobacteraceae bacterium]|nr:hypothetical protein [Candidatus Eremiobacteraceae bacterium]